MMKKIIFSLLVYHSSLLLSLYNPKDNTITVKGIFDNEYIARGLKDQKKLITRWQKFGEPSLFSVPIVCWLTSRYLASKGKRLRLMENIKQYSVWGIQAHLCYRVSKTCYDFYQAVVEHNAQKYVDDSIKHNFLTDFIASMFYVSKSILESRIFGDVFIAYLKHQSIRIFGDVFIAYLNHRRKRNNSININIELQEPTVKTTYNRDLFETKTVKKSSFIKEYNEEEQSKLKKKEQTKKDNPLAFLGLLSVPVVVTAGLLWALVYNQPFFKECKNLERLLEDDNKKEAAILIKEYFEIIDRYNDFESDAENKANKKREKNKWIEVLIYNKGLMEKNSDKLNAFFRDFSKDISQTNPYITTMQEEEYYNEEEDVSRVINEFFKDDAGLIT